MSRRVALAAFGVAGVATLVGLAPGAQAHPQQAEQHTVSWVTPADPTGPMPVDWVSAGHPQRLLSADGSTPDCLPKPAWVQVDQYTVPAGDAADFQQLIDSGVLGEVNGQPGDSRWVQSWRFVLVPRCVEATPTPSDTPTVTPSETPTADAPVPSDTPTSDAPTADTPTEEPVTEAAAAPVSTDAPAAPAAEVVVVPVADEQLANTGTDMSGVLLVSGGMLALGSAALVLAARRPGSHR